MKKVFCSIEEAVEALAQGRVIIVVDSEDREDEGDFMAAAATITPEAIHFMSSIGRGQLCMPVTPALAERLQLTSLVADESNLTVPRFTIPVDHRSCTTGISPLERALSMHAMLDPTTGPQDFIRPGHVFPLVARPGGVLERMGHTESAVDMTRLAGLTPAGVLCEICSRDGRNMAKRSELLEIAEQFDLPITTIDALIELRRREAREEQTLLDTLGDVQQLVRSVSTDRITTPASVGATAPVAADR